MSGTIANYFRRSLQPRYWPELGRMAKRRLAGAPSGVSRDARAPCAALAVTAPVALERLGFSARNLRRLGDEHPQTLAEAERRVSAARGVMGGAADVDLLYTLCRQVGATHVLETGVAFGWSSLAILLALSDRAEARLASIDLPYLGRNLDDLVGLAVPESLRGPWSLHRGADRDCLRRALAEVAPVDLAHYDSDKSYEGRMWAYPLIFQSLRPGGVLMSDDIGDNAAFLDFAERVAITPVVVRASHEDKYVGVIRKGGA